MKIFLSASSACFVLSLDAPGGVAAHQSQDLFLGGEVEIKFSRLLEAACRHGIAHSLWSWKQMDFGLIDPRMDGVRDELLTLL